MSILLQFLLLLALTTSPCVLATNDAAPKMDANNLRQGRRLGTTPKKTHKIKPLGTPHAIKDANGSIKRRRSVVDLSAITLGDDESHVEIQLMSDEDPLMLTMKRSSGKSGGFYESWYGMDATTGHHLTMVKTMSPFGDAITTGTMLGRNGTVYQIRTIAGGDVVAEEVKQGMFDQELDAIETNMEGDAGDSDPTTNSGGGLQNLRRLDTSSELDIMVLYTRGAMCSAAGLGVGCSDTPENRANIEGVVALAIVETNRAYELSGIPTKFRLVKTHFEPSYDDYANTFETTIANLRYDNDGQLDYVHAMRDEYGADFVSMLVDTGTYCGIGYLPSSPSAADAFSLTQWNCATGYYSFAHELGHNMGCNHNVESTSGLIEGNSNYGYRDPQARFRSILAYDCTGGCTRVQQFSSATVKYNGLPIGSASADNAAQITRNLDAFANFRQAKSAAPSTQPPTRSPTASPTRQPTRSPTAAPTRLPTNAPVPTTRLPTNAPRGNNKNK